MNVIVNTQPPVGGSFIYHDPDSKKIFRHHHPDYLAAIARKHRMANNYPIGAHWTQDFIDNVCAHTPGQICFDEPPLTATQKVKAVAQAIYQAALGGFKATTPEEVDARIKVCETSGVGGGACQYFNGTRGILHVMCGKCGCSSVKLHLATSECPLGLWKK